MTWQIPEFQFWLNQRRDKFGNLFLLRIVILILSEAEHRCVQDDETERVKLNVIDFFHLNTFIASESSTDFFRTL